MRSARPCCAARPTRRPGQEGAGRRAGSVAGRHARRGRGPGGAAHPPPAHRPALCPRRRPRPTANGCASAPTSPSSGRTEGNVRLPHDGLASSRHAEVVRQRGPNGYRWALADLQSTNGTFVRIGSILLRNESEFILGSGRLPVRGRAPAAPAVGPAGASPQGTQAWSGAVPVRSLVPSLVELAPAGPVNRFALTLPEYWIGRDARTCAIARPDDVLVNARHARLYRDPKGQWRIENNKSLNGLWLRSRRADALASGCQFRVGEQRLHLPGDVMKIRRSIAAGAECPTTFGHGDPVIRIGRDPDCELLLQGQAGDLVPRQHACIELSAVGATLTDIGSSNGTLLNDKLLKEPATFRVGDRIQMGFTGTTLSVLALDLGSPPVRKATRRCRHS